MRMRDPIVPRKPPIPPNRVHKDKKKEWKKGSGKYPTPLHEQFVII